MEIPQALLEVAEDVLEQGRRRRAKVRTILGWFGASRRRANKVATVRRALEETGLRTEPDFEDEFFDNQVYFVPAGKADLPERDEEIKSQDENAVDGVVEPESLEEYEPPLEIREPVTLSISENPTYRVSHLMSARKAVESVPPDCDISRAKTIMLMKDFDQLPVMQDTRKVKGVISWKSIAQAEASGAKVERVNQCMNDAQIIMQSDSMFEAVDRVLKYSFVLVRNQRQEISGIITAYDVANQFQDLTQPYLLVGEIERLLRNLIAETFSLEDIRTVQDGGDRVIEDVTDMTFGQYQRLLEKPENWERLCVNVERKLFVEKLDQVRLARNEVMHFDPEGVGPDGKRQLWEFANFLHCLQAPSK